MFDRYQILINGEVAENVTETQKWLVNCSFSFLNPHYCP